MKYIQERFIMKNMNSCIFTGNVVKDPELKYTNSGKAVCRLTIAVNGYKENEVCFPNLEAWEKKAEFISNYIKKGNKVIVNCSYKINKYEQEGKQLNWHYFVVNEIEFAQKKNESNTTTENFPDDIPF